MKNAAFEKQCYYAFSPSEPYVFNVLDSIHPPNLAENNASVPILPHISFENHILLKFHLPLPLLSVSSLNPILKLKTTQSLKVFI